jgi:hypothetical protein
MRGRRHATKELEREEREEIGGLTSISRLIKRVHLFIYL